MCPSSFQSGCLTSVAPTGPRVTGEVVLMLCSHWALAGTESQGQPEELTTAALPKGRDKGKKHGRDQGRVQKAPLGISWLRVGGVRSSRWDPKPAPSSHLSPPSPGPLHCSRRGTDPLLPLEEGFACTCVGRRAVGTRHWCISWPRGRGAPVGIFVKLEVEVCGSHVEAA